MSGPTDEFMRSLWRLNHAIERVSRRMEVTSGVTVQQRMIIRCIGRYPGLGASQLAEHFHLDAGTVSAALGRLERKGLIERRPGHRDRRRITIGLTPRGRAVDGALASPAEEAVEVLLKTVSEDDVTRALSVIGTLTGLLEVGEVESPQ